MVTWLRCFEAAARLGSFTRAAAELHLTQSAVSQQIRQLERRINCKLFERLPGRVDLTEFGSRLQSEVSPAMERIAHAVSSLQKSTGPLYVSCAPSFAISWLMTRLPVFLRRHDDIDVRLNADFHQLNRSRFLQEKLHAAIRYDAIEYTDLAAEELMSEYLLPVASPTYIAQFPRIAGSFNLTGTTLLHDSAAWDGAPDRFEWQRCLHELERTMDSGIDERHFNLAELANSAARAGDGIAIGRMALIYEDLSTGRLLPLIERALPTPERYVLLTDKNSDRRVSVFAAWLREECALFRAARTALLHKLAIRELPG
jgi:LysR family glycine cleavage system transcriptional activator